MGLKQTSWIYFKTEDNLWTVGFYDPSGQWKAESDHSSCQSAAQRVHFLNGGNQPIVNLLKMAKQYRMFNGGDLTMVQLRELDKIISEAEGL